MAPGRMGRLFILMLGSEGLQSVFHFGLGLILIRTLPAHDYGVFSIIFLVAGVALTYTRALASVPATIYLAQGRGRPAARVHDVVFGTAATVIALVAGAAVALGCQLWLGRPDVALASGALVAAWSLRSHVRIVCFARRRAGLSSLGDGVFLATGTLAGALLMQGGAAGHGMPVLTEVLLLLAVAHGLALLVLVAVEGRPVRVAARRTIRRRYVALRGSLTWSVISTTTSNALMPAQMMLIALVAGAAAYAPIGATLLLFAPLRLAAVALCNLVQPELSARLADGGHAGALRLVRTSTAFMALVCLLFGAALAVVFPQVEGRLLAKFAADQPLALIAGLVWGATTLFTLYAVPRALLEAALAFRSIASVTAASAFVGLVATAALLRWGTPALALAGFVVSEAIIALACWARVRAALRPSAREEAGPPRRTVDVLRPVAESN